MFGAARTEAQAEAIVSCAHLWVERYSGGLILMAFPQYDR